jgi:hypothetical protein
MDNVFSAFDWISSHWEGLAAIASTAAAMTPTQDDDSVVGRVTNIGRLLFPALKR